MLFALAAGARASLALMRPMWHDEIFTTWAARLSPRGLLQALRQDSGPPLFYLLERPFVRLAERTGEDALVRVLPWLAAFAVFTAIFTLPRGAPRAWFAALVAVSPLLLLYSAEARAYSTLALLDLAVFLFLFRGPRTPARLALGGLAAAAALWTHYLAVFFLAAAGSLLLATRRWRAAAVLAGAGLLFLPWFPILLSQPRGATAWIHESAGRSAQMFLSALGGSGRVPLPVGVPLPAALLLTAAVVGAALAAAVAFGTFREREGRDAVFVVAGTLVLLLAASVVRPVAVAGRSEMAILPIWLWAVAGAASSRPAVRWLAAAAALVGLVTSAWTLAAPRVEAPPGRIARLVTAAAGREDRVIASTAFYLPLRLAADRGQLRGRLQAFPPDLATHPGWFLPEPPPGGSFGPLAKDLAGIAPGGRAFVVAHPLWAGPELARVLEARGTHRNLVKEPDALVVLWSAPAVPEGAGSAAPARDRQKREPLAGR